MIEHESNIDSSLFLFVQSIQEFLKLIEIYFQNALQVENTAYHVVFGFRTSVEDLEKLLYPDWLHDTKLNRMQRLVISLTLGITKYARFLKSRIDEYPDLSVWDVALSIDTFYNKLSIKFGHRQEIPTPRTPEEWEKIYEFVGARHEHEKNSLKVVLEPFKSTTKGRCEKSKIMPNFHKRCNDLYLKNLG